MRGENLVYAIGAAYSHLCGEDEVVAAMDPRFSGGRNMILRLGLHLEDKTTLETSQGLVVVVRPCQVIAKGIDPRNTGTLDFLRMKIPKNKRKVLVASEDRILSGLFSSTILDLFRL